MTLVLAVRCPLQMYVDVKFGWEEARLQEPRHRSEIRGGKFRVRYISTSLVVEEKQRNPVIA